MKVALYCRVSTDEQARTGESVLDQRQALERWAAEQGHTVAGVYPDEGYSAHRKYTSRPALRRLLADVEAGNVELVAFTKFDRWTRKAADYYALQEILDRASVPWCAILEDYETMTADGRFKVGIMLSVNQHEAERTSERIKFTFAEKRRRGEIVSGNMPRGYRLQDGKPVKDPETADGIAAFWSAYLSGRGQGEAILAAGAHGVRLATSSASFMLQNAAHYSGTIQGVQCEAYITPQQAAEILATRKSRPRSSGKVYLFSGLCYCGACGRRFGAHVNYYKTKAGRGEQVFYNCSYRYRTKPHECGNHVSIYESDIERELLFRLGDAIEEEARRVELQIEARQRTQTVDRAKIRAKLEERKRRAWDAYLGGAVDLAAYKAEQERIDAQLAELTPAPETAHTPEEIRQSLPAGWRNQYFELDARHKRQFWARVLDRVEIMPDRSVQIHVKTAK